MNMSKKYSVIYRGACKKIVISPQKTHPPMHHCMPKIKGINKTERKKQERKPKQGEKT